MDKRGGSIQKPENFPAVDAQKISAEKGDLHGFPVGRQIFEIRSNGGFDLQRGRRLGCGPGDRFLIAENTLMGAAGMRNKYRNDKRFYNAFNWRHVS